MGARRQRGTDDDRGGGAVRDRLRTFRDRLGTCCPARPGARRHETPITMERFEVDAVSVLTASAAGPVGIDWRANYQQTVYGLAPNPSPIHATGRTIRFSPSGHVAV